MSTAAYWVWFGISWVFLLAVFFKRWREREAADQADTDKRLVQTKPQQDRLADAILALINRPS